MHKPLRLGLTGGIGSGKSTVASFLADAGAAVLDADAISRSLTQVGGRAIPALLAQFGETMITPEGALNRDAMRSLVFTNPDSKRQLESIIHPLVSLVLQEQAQTAIQQGAPCLVFDVPLLVESGDRWRRQVDWVCVVDCQTETQIQRVMDRSQLTRPEIEAIMVHQASRAQRMASADAVIYNGFDEMFVGGVTMGADGGIGTTYNFMGRLFVDMYNALRAGRLVSRSELEALVLGLDNESASNTLEVHISSIRRKLGRGVIETSRGLGYRLAT